MILCDMIQANDENGDKSFYKMICYDENEPCFIYLFRMNAFKHGYSDASILSTLSKICNAKILVDKLNEKKYELN